MPVPISWGLVDGKSQTRLPWNSWKKPNTYDEPAIRFHEVLHTDGTPYRQAEFDGRRCCEGPGLSLSVTDGKPGIRRRTGLTGMTKCGRPAGGSEA